MQITNIPLVASGQRRKASKEKNIDETQSSCQNSALLQGLFTDTHKFTIFYLLYKWAVWDTSLFLGSEWEKHWSVASPHTLDQGSNLGVYPDRELNL